MRRKNESLNVSLLCPHCKSDKTQVRDSRREDARVKRHRDCLNCASRFSTFEITAEELAPMDRDCIALDLLSRALERRR